MEDSKLAITMMIQSYLIQDLINLYTQALTQGCSLVSVYFCTFQALPFQNQNFNRSSSYLLVVFINLGLTIFHHFHCASFEESIVLGGQATFTLEQGQHYCLQYVIVISQARVGQVLITMISFEYL